MTYLKIFYGYPSNQQPVNTPLTVIGPEIVIRNISQGHSIFVSTSPSFNTWRAFPIRPGTTERLPIPTDQSTDLYLYCESPYLDQAKAKIWYFSETP